MIKHGTSLTEDQYEAIRIRANDFLYIMKMLHTRIDDNLRRMMAAMDYGGRYSTKVTLSKVTDIIVNNTKHEYSYIIKGLPSTPFSLRHRDETLIIPVSVFYVSEEEPYDHTFDIFSLYLQSFTEKAHVVITNKVSQCIHLARTAPKPEKK